MSAIGTNDLARPSRLTQQTDPFSRSFGPSSMRSGTPSSSHSLNLKPGERLSRASSLTATPAFLSAALDVLGRGQDLVDRIGALPDRHDDDLDRGEAGREDEAVVVAVRHDDRAHQTGRNAPRRVERVLPVAGFGLELEVEGLREVLPEVVGRSRLQRLAVLHQRLDAVRVVRAGEFLLLGLQSLEDGDRHVLLGERRVDVEHPARFVLGFVVGRVGGVPLLPQELGRAQEQARAHLPPDHVRPLVDQQREIAVRLDPLREHRIDDRLRGGTDDQLFFEGAFGIRDDLGLAVDRHATSAGCG